MTTIFPRASSSWTRNGRTSMIRASTWRSLVTIPDWLPVKLMASPPSSRMASDRSDIEMRSPAVSSMSSSRRSGLGETSLASASSSSVVSPMAETTTTTSWPSRLVRMTRSATCFMRETSATLEPPYFWTTIGTRLSYARRRQNAPGAPARTRSLAAASPDADARPRCSPARGRAGTTRRPRRGGQGGAAAQPVRRPADDTRAARPRVDLRAVPARSVLVFEQHEVSRSVQARLAPRVVQQHEREQALRLGVSRQQLDEHAPELDRLLAELVPHESRAGGGRVALVEHEIDHHHHRLEPVGERIVGRHLVGDAGGADLALGSHEPLRHGRHGHQEGARDLLGRKTPERAQRERHLRVGRERRVAAREDQAEPIFRHGRIFLLGQQLDMPRDFVLLL